MAESLPKTHRILEKGLMQFRPFGVEENGERIRDTTGVKVRAFIDYLEEQEDPLQPLKMLEHLRSGRLTRDDAQWCLETIYSIVVDRFDRFLDACGSRG